MRIRFKTLKNELFQVDLDPSNTVQQLKDAVHSSRPDFPSSSGLRLIYSGTVLDDNERTLSSLNMKEGEFIVCMLGKKPSVTPAVSASSPERPKAAAPPATSSPAANTNTNTITSTTSPILTVAPLSPAVAVAAATNANSEMLSNLVAMTGFPEALCTQALEAANGDPNLAFEILSGYSAAPSPPRRGGQGQGHSGSTRAAPTSVSASAAASPLDRLRQHPQFESLKQVIRSNPQALTHVIALINQSDPQLALAINSNPEEFQRIMSEPLVMPPQPPTHEHNFEMAVNADDDDEDDDYGDDEEGDAEMHLDELAAHMGLTREDLLQRILHSQAGGVGGGMEELSEEDEAVVERIVQEYGFQFEDVVDVYLECNRDEHATIQTLFEEAENGGGEEGEDEFEP